MAALRSNGRAIIFYSCDLLFFSRSNLRGRKTPPRGVFRPRRTSRMSECVVISITQIRWVYLYPLHFEGAKTCKLLGDFSSISALSSLIT